MTKKDCLQKDLDLEEWWAITKVHVQLYDSSSLKFGSSEFTLSPKMISLV